MLGVITGTGIYSLGRVTSKVKVDTQYGAASVLKSKMHDEDFYFIPRHGENHTIPPHKINYKANIEAFRKLGVTAIFSVFSAGAISKFKPGDIVLLDDFIGLNTPITFFDDFSLGIKHKNFTEPFDKDFTNALLESAVAGKVKIEKGGIIATTVGPRFETKSEITALKTIGANLVSMTAAYEITLANEAEIDFTALAIVTNFAAGLGKKPPTSSEIMKATREAKPKIETLVNGIVDYMGQ
jgi:5'-methylthioadenosine phosphorylase